MSSELVITEHVTVAVPAAEHLPAPNAVECPECYAIVLASRLAGHRETHE
jgi:hypothetical protein